MPIMQKRAATYVGIALSFLLAAGCRGAGDATDVAAGAGGAASSSASAGGHGGTGDGGGGSGAGTASSLVVETYTAAPYRAENSHLILGAEEALLVDGQFLKADAEKVVALIKTSGKALRTVFLTHAHPDHYLGFDIIRQAFPDAEFVTTQAVLDDFNAGAEATFKLVKSQLGDQVADALVTPKAIAGTKIKIGGVAIDVIELPEAGETPHAAALSFEAPDKTLIAGDLLYNRVHLWLAECGAEGWKLNLAVVKDMGFSTIYPGHGAKGGPEIIDLDAEYIETVVPILDAAATVEEAKAQVAAKYPEPGWVGAGLLDLGTQFYFQNCKK